MVEDEEIFEGRWFEYRRMQTALLSGLLSASAYGLESLGAISQDVRIFIFATAMLVGGYSWAREGIEELLFERKVGIEILMMAAALGAAVLGIWEEAAFLVFLYSAAESLEEFTYVRTRSSIRALLDLAPKTARVRVGGTERIIPAADIKRGDLFLVRPGESIPTDGLVVAGRSSIDEAPVTGESAPVDKSEGMLVFAGTINLEGAIEVEATTSFEENTLSKIIHLVEEAQEVKGRSQLFIEKFGDRYSPLVLAGAVLLILASPLLEGGFYEWSERAVVLLVAAAPCALVISTPIAIAAGIGRAGKSGILVKGGVHLENLGKIRAVALDKTGTLTRGKPEVTDLIPFRGDEVALLARAYSLERLSDHPVARAIARKAISEKVEAGDVENFTCLIGTGVSGDLDGETVYAGKPELFEGLGVQISDPTLVDRLRAEGKTAVLVGTARGLDGIIGVRDEIRAGAKEAVAYLHGLGLKVVMLTGDSEAVARAISADLGIDDFRAGLLPEEKSRAVAALEEEFGPVAMVGDGINDGPALARATVGIAMGAAGTDAAIEAADIALMADDLGMVPRAMEIGKRSRRISFQNIAFSLLVLAIMVPSALLGGLSVAEAVLFHESSEILAVLNGLRAARG
ncbi:MAG: putative cadmium-transporting ATPase [Methanothrix sp.]|jgi:Cd2+/Zn2+-exporting ATPase|nr:MAG: putative cadmium-transporting ATPase [Methanothrix sp.]